MKIKLSLLVISKNAEKLIKKCLCSVLPIADEIIVVDNYSKDQTVNIAKEIGAKVYLHNTQNLGELRAYALSKTHGDWILVLDTDETLTLELKKEIRSLISQSRFNQLNQSALNAKSGFMVPFQNHFLGKPVNYGGEDYKMLRLFKKNAVKIEESLVHEKYELKKGNIGFLQNKIHHYSYRSISQTFKKFTDYAVREAKQKYENKEQSSFKKIFIYPIHMFWARFVEDKGYKDGLFRIPLDLGFAYMEFMMYVILFVLNYRKVKRLPV